MTLKTVTVDGIPVEVTDQGATVIGTLQQRIADANTKLADAEKSHQTALAAKDAEMAKKGAEIDALKGKILSDADLDKRVQARADLITKAHAIAKDVKTEGLSDSAIRKAVVSPNSAMRRLPTSRKPTSTPASTCSSRMPARTAPIPSAPSCSRAFRRSAMPTRSQPMLTPRWSPT